MQCKLRRTRMGGTHTSFRHSGVGRGPALNTPGPSSAPQNSHGWHPCEFWGAVWRRAPLLRRAVAARGRRKIPHGGTRNFPCMHARPARMHARMPSHHSPHGAANRYQLVEESGLVLLAFSVSFSVSCRTARSAVPIFACCETMRFASAKRILPESCLARR